MEKRIAMLCLWISGILSAMAADRPALDLSVAGVKPDSVALISTCPAVSFPEIDAIGPESMLARHNKEYRMRPFRRPFMFDILTGPAIALGSHGSRHDWSGPRPNAVNWFTIRIAYYPLHHWGVYLSTSYSSYKPRRYWADIIGLPLVTPSSDGCLMSTPLFNVSGEVGISYQVQYRKWVLQARAGYGIFSMGADEDIMGIYYRMDDHYVYPKFEICRHIRSNYVSVGLTAGYRLARGVNVVLEAGYRLPFHYPHIWLSYFAPGGHHYSGNNEMHMPGAVAEKEIVSSPRWGHDLMISCGFQFVLDTARTPRTKASPRHKFTAPRYFHTR